jgi:hypothetical protein
MPGFRKPPPDESNLTGHHRIRHDIIADTGTVTLRHAGRLHHIGIGRTYARTHITVLIRELDIHILLGFPRPPIRKSRWRRSSGCGDPKQEATPRSTLTPG